jgi:hypothetical protein
MRRLDHMFPTRSTESVPGLVDRLFSTRSAASILGFIALTILTVFAIRAGADEALPQSLAAIETTAREFILKQARAYGGEPHVEIGAPDPRLHLARCNLPLIAELPPGSRPVGSTTVGVR